MNWKQLAIRECRGWLFQLEPGTEFSGSRDTGMSNLHDGVLGAGLGEAPGPGFWGAMVLTLTHDWIKRGLVTEVRAIRENNKHRRYTTVYKKL